MLTELNAYSQMAMGMMQSGKPSPDGEKAANTIVGNVDTYFAASAKPDNVSDADWQKARSGTETTAHLALGWVAMQNKDYPKAEQEFAKVLQLDANNAQASYWLATVIALQRKVERQPEALYSFARSVVVTGPGALTPDLKKAADDYLTRAYKSYHGDTSGLDELKKQAEASPLPPSGFTIESVTDIEKKKFANEEEFNKAHPDLALWRSIKATLTGDGGQAYFDKMKGALVPGGAQGIKYFKGKVVSATPKEIVVGVDNPAGDATLRFEAALRGKVDTGTDIEFEGMPDSFTKDPYMITFAVEKSNVKGLPASASAPAAHRPAARKKR